MKTSGLHLVAPDLIWKQVTGDVQAAPGYGYMIDVSVAARTITLPASPTIGDTVAVKDYRDNAATNNITVLRNGSNIRGSASNYTIDKDSACLQFVYKDSSYGWAIVINWPYSTGGSATTGPQTAYAAYGETTGGTKLTSCESFDGSSWTTETAGPSPARVQCGNGSVNPYFYTCGGRATAIISDTDAFDGSTWHSMVNMSTAARVQGGASKDDRFYSLGGLNSSGSKTQTVYSCDGASWYTETSMPAPARSNSAGFYIKDDSIYIAGGYDSSNNDLNDCDGYDGNTWTAASNLPDYSREAAGAGVDTLGYYSGGKNGASYVRQYCFSFDGSSWTTETNTGYNVFVHSAADFGEDYLIMGGHSGSAVRNDVSSYDGSSWTTETLLNTRRDWFSGGSL